MRSVYQREDVLPLVAGVFRELGYDGTSISRITEMTGLGKGSLYHFFPGGKEEMAAAVLAEVDSWFTLNIFTPLHEQAAASAIPAMWQAVESYFHSGQRICLLGAFALDETRDRFASTISRYFSRWIEALTAALIRNGQQAASARENAQDAVLGIQGAITLSRAMNDPALFTAALVRLSQRL